MEIDDQLWLNEGGDDADGTLLPESRTTGRLLAETTDTRHVSDCGAGVDIGRKRFANGPAAHEAAALLSHAFGCLGSDQLTSELERYAVRRVRHHLDRADQTDRQTTRRALAQRWAQPSPNGWPANTKAATHK